VAVFSEHSVHKKLNILSWKCNNEANENKCKQRAVH